MNRTNFMEVLEVLERDKKVYDIFKNCPYEILRNVRLKKYPEGKFVLEQGEIYNTFYIIVEGYADIFVESEQGKKYYISTYDKGRFIGELEMFEQKPYMSRVESRGAVMTLEISRENYLKWLECDQNFSLYILRTLCIGTYSSMQKMGNDTLYTGRGVLCNRPYSGSEVIKDYGEEHQKTGKLIVYTSADSVFQIAAHEEIVPVEELYRYCRIARELLQGEHGVGRVIARPFVGEYPFTRTVNRHDFSLEPSGWTMLDAISAAGKEVLGVGKIYDIFAGRGITDTWPNKGNDLNMERTLACIDQDFEGLCFVNLVEFDMLYGHRNDIEGYTNALNRFDEQLGIVLERLKKDDLLIITADHGCDPGFKGTDHSREFVPCLCFGKNRKQGVNLGIRSSYADIAQTMTDYLGVEYTGAGESFLRQIQ